MIDFITYINNNNCFLLKDASKIYPNINQVIERRKSNFKEFKSFQIKTGKKNRICFKIVDSIDKIVIELLNLYFKQHIVPYKQYSKSVSQITKQIQGRIKKQYECVLKTDIKNFFDTIDHHILLDKISNLRQPIICDYVQHYLNTFNNIGKKNIGLPSGINFSQILSEFYLIEFDKTIYSFCKKNDLYYYRYCDDILIVGKSESKIYIEIKNLIFNELNKLYLTVNEKKTVFNKKDKFNYLGYTHSNSRISLSIQDSTINKIKGLVTSRIFKAIDFCREYVEYEEITALSDFYKRSIVQLNRVIKGTNNNWSTNILLDPYGIAPIFSLINNYQQIFEMESWFGKIIKYYNYRVIDLLDHDEQKIFNDEIQNETVNLESLAKWTFRYKKNLCKTIIKSIIAESKYPRIYIGIKYTNWINKDDLIALNILIKTKLEINKDDMKRAIIEFSKFNLSQISNNDESMESSEFYESNVAEEEDNAKLSDNLCDVFDEDEVSCDPDLREYWDSINKFSLLKIDTY